VLVRLAFVYALLAFALAAAARLQGMPGAFAATGLVLGLLGLGVGVRPLYAVVYGRRALAQDPAAIERDVENWQRLAFVLAAACLALAAAFAFYGFDVAHAP
jgi:hypothetical protein